MEIVSKTEMENAFEYVVNQIKNNRLYCEECENSYLEYHIGDTVEYLNENKKEIYEYIGYIYLFKNDKEYTELPMYKFSNKYYEKLITKINNNKNCFRRVDNYYYGCEINNSNSDFIGELFIETEIILESTYHLTVEYSLLSPFERESVKCFGKNLFSGEEYNTKEFRELS